jgi:hypothetical protein
MSLLLSNFYPKADAVLVTGNQNITGVKNFSSRPTVSGIGVLLQGEAAAAINLEGLELNLSGVLDILDDGIIGSSLFDGNRSIRQLPGLDEEYGGDTVSGFLNNMFFPPVFPNISLNNFAIRSYGIDSINGDIFAGFISLNDVSSITGIAYFSGSTRLFGPFVRNSMGNYSTTPQVVPFPSAIRESTVTSSFYTQIYVPSNPLGTVFNSNSQRVRFEPRYYFGVSNSANLGVNVITLNSSNPLFYDYPFLSKPTGLTHTFNPNGQYIYFAYPNPSVQQDRINGWGNLISIYDTLSNIEYINTFSDLGHVNINFTFKTLRYRIYRSENLIYQLPTDNNLNLRFRFN